MLHQPAGVTVAVCDDVREGVREAVVCLTRAENRGERIHIPREPRFKSLIMKSLFVLVLYSWPLSDEVT